MNPNLITATVEIFHDVECGRQSTTLVLEGMEVVSAIAGRLELVRESRLLKISAVGAENITLGNVRWPELEADINIVLTERGLVTSGVKVAQEKTGRNVAGVALTGLDIMLVNNRRVSSTASTTSHELGHLFGLKTDGAWSDKSNSDHCCRTDCVMYPVSIVHDEVVCRESKGLKKALESAGLRRPDRDLIERCWNEEFCPECTTQLANAGQARALAKVGVYLPTAKPVARRVRRA